MTSPHSSYRVIAKSLWSVLFEFEGNVLCAVLPFCLANCLLLLLVELISTKKEIGFSPNGHGLLTLLVSFLVISKVNLAYERYKEARQSVGNAFLHLRELIQLIITVSTSYKDDEQKTVDKWRSECIDQITQLLDSTKAVVQDGKLARYLARNETGKSLSKHQQSLNAAWDKEPLHLAQSLRVHMYASDVGLQILERVSLMNKLNEYVFEYRRLLALVSTPIPLPLVQMGRAFLFLWTFSMPLVLRQGPFTDLLTAEIFLFFLTYGFVGLELVSIKLSDPFGDGKHDVNVAGLRDATIIGIEHDLEELAVSIHSVSQRRLQFQGQKQSTGENLQVMDPSMQQPSYDIAEAAIYHVMPDSSMA